MFPLETFQNCNLAVNLLWYRRTKTILPYFCFTAIKKARILLLALSIMSFCLFRLAKDHQWFDHSGTASRQNPYDQKSRSWWTAYSLPCWWYEKRDGWWCRCRPAPCRRVCIRLNTFARKGKGRSVSDMRLHIRLRFWFCS